MSALPAQVARAHVLWSVHGLGVLAARGDVDWHGPPAHSALLELPRAELGDQAQAWVAFGERLAALDATPHACSPAALAYVYWFAYRAQKSAVDAETDDDTRREGLARPPVVPSRAELATVAAEIGRTGGTDRWARFATAMLGTYRALCEVEPRKPRPQFTRGRGA